MPHAAFYVVEHMILQEGHCILNKFQCRTRLSMWWNLVNAKDVRAHDKFQCRTRLSMWWNRDMDQMAKDFGGFNAARGFLCGGT